MIYEIAISVGALMALWWILPFVLVFGVLAIVGIFLGIWLFIAWLCDKFIYAKRRWFCRG
jgi:hypothetical protein